LDAAFKLSQGRTQDHPKIIKELEARGGSASAIADAMKDQSGA
jgi:hypothetical protein